MFLGAVLALMGGAAIVYWLAGRLLAMLVVFLAMHHVFVIGYEEPTLRKTFGAGL